MFYSISCSPKLPETLKRELGRTAAVLSVVLRCVDGVVISSTQAGENLDLLFAKARKQPSIIGRGCCWSVAGYTAQQVNHEPCLYCRLTMDVPALYHCTVGRLPRWLPTDIWSNFSGFSARDVVFLFALLFHAGNVGASFTLCAAVSTDVSMLSCTTVL